MENCKHYWNYEHTVYGGNIIRRWCGRCGLIQCAIALHWRPQRQSEFQYAPEGYDKNLPKANDYIFEGDSEV